MAIETLLIQLGVAGGTLLVLYRVLTILVPAMLHPLRESVAALTRAIESAAHTQAEAATRLARLEGKLDAIHNLTPTHPEPVPYQRQTPALGVRVVGGGYAQHRRKDG